MRMMKMTAKYRELIALVVISAMAASCNSGVEDVLIPASRGVNYIEVDMEDWLIARTRANLYSDDGWSVESFSQGDAIGFFCAKGVQNPENADDYSLSAYNAKMSFEGITGGKYRFGASGIVIDPATVYSGDYSMMYFPYYPDMPAADELDKPGLPLRQLDERDGIEKCVDIFGTTHEGDNAGTSVIHFKIDGNASSMMLTPKLYRYCTSLVLQRGEGFDNPADSRIWIVMQNPHTHLRVNQMKQSGNNRPYFDIAAQYYTEEPEDEVMIDLMEEYNLMHDYDPGKKLTVNKYAVWQTWVGPDQKVHVTLLPSQNIYYILIQDNNGYWQCVTDFYLSSAGRKSGTYRWRYTLKIELQGIGVVARPVTVEPWGDEENISDDRKVGMSTPEEYSGWVGTYNAYIQNGRDETRVEELRKYGDAVYNESTGERKWTFYINDEIVFNNNDIFPTIKKLEDKLEGSSTYTNYDIRNLRGTLIEEMAEGGVLRALDFKDIYLVQPENADSPYGALISRMTGGMVESCNITNGVIISENEAGMIAGEVSGGSVRNCTISGNVIGSASVDDKGLFGKLTDGGTQPEESGNKISGLKFIRN